MALHGNNWAHEYEKNVFMHVAMCIAVLAIAVGFQLGFEKAFSIMLGFGAVYICYRIASRQLVSTGTLRAWFVSLVKVSIYRLVLAGILMGSCFWLKKHIPNMLIEPVYVVLGFIVSVIVYRIRVVLGEVKNV